NGFRRSNKRIRNGYHNIARLDARGDQRETHSIRSAPHSNAISGAAESAEVLFKTRHHGPADKPGRFQGLLENRYQLVFQLPMRGDEVEKGDARTFHELVPP